MVLISGFWPEGQAKGRVHRLFRTVRSLAGAPAAIRAKRARANPILAFSEGLAHGAESLAHKKGNFECNATGFEEVIACMGGARYHSKYQP